VFVVISKLITPLIAPLGLSFALWAMGILLYWRGRRQWGRFFGLAGIVVVLFFSCPLVGEGLLRTLEEEYPMLEPQACPQADAVVVLGGVTDPPVPPRKSVEVGPGFDRLLHGMRLLREGRAPYLILSGGTISFLVGSDMSEAVQLQTLALEYGIDPETILLEERSRNTYENAVFIRQLLQERGLERVLLVTSAAHMRRAAATFRSQGVEFVPAPADVRAGPPSFNPIRLLPTLRGLNCSTVAIKEYVGWWVYRLRGWIE